MRFTDRQIRALEERARREGVSLSEAVRRCVDQSDTPAAAASPRVRPPTPEERKTFDQMFAAVGLTSRRRSPRR